jgi:hypothetical protein
MREKRSVFVKKFPSVFVSVGGSNHRPSA